MAVKGKRADESAPKPSAKKEKKAGSSSAKVVEGDFGGKSIGDFKPEDVESQGNPGNGENAPPAPPASLENDGFSSDPDHNPNINPGSPDAFDKRADQTDEEKTDSDAISENAADPNIGQLSDEDKAKLVKVPRTPKLPTMESAGDPELEAMATEHEDIQNTIKTMNKRLNTLKDGMLNKMKKVDLQRYSHDGFIIEREEKGETVKVKSVKVADED